MNALFGVVYPYLHIAYPWLDLLDIKCYHCYLKGNDYTHNPHNQSAQELTEQMQAYWDYKSCPLSPSHGNCWWMISLANDGNIWGVSSLLCMELHLLVLCYRLYYDHFPADFFWTISNIVNYGVKVFTVSHFFIVKCSDDWGAVIICRWQVRMPLSLQCARWLASYKL